MGLIQDFRTSLENPQTPLSYPAEWLLDIFNGGRTDSGKRVSEMSALQVTTIFACVEIKAGAIGFLDLPVYERIVNEKNGRISRRVAHDHDLFDLLEYEPNPEMSSFTLRKTVQAHRMLWGNGYIEIERDGGNRVVALWPRNPARIRLKRASQKMAINGELVLPGDMIYLTNEGMETESVNPESPTPNPGGTERTILPADIIHIPGLALDGRVGQSVIQLARNAVGLALATESFGAKFFGNGAVGYGVFEYPSAMTPEDRETFRRSLQEAYGGENMQRPMVLEGGIKYTQTGTKPNEAQFLETRKFQIEENCRLFGVPPHMVGVSEKTNRANTEQIGLEFVTFGLNPDIRLWQQEFKRKLFPRPATGRSAARHFSALFDTSPLTMPDADSRRNFYNSGKQWGWLSTNDIREREQRLNPVEDESADAYWMPINMQDAATAYDEAGQAPQEPAADGATKAGKRDRMGQRLVKAYFRMFRDAFGRVCARSEADPMVFSRAFRPIFLSIGEELDQLAAAEFNADPSPDELDASRFLADYLESMRSRFGEWKSANGHGDQVARRELARAVRAISIEIYRSIATRKAKAETGQEVMYQ